MFRSHSLLAFPAMESIAISKPPYECVGDGLLYNGVSRTPVDTLRSWLFPKRKNASPLKKTKSWWQAQLALYGIEIPKNSSTIATLRAKLEASLQQGLCDRLPPHLQEMKDTLNAQYAAERDRQRKRRFLQAGGTDEEALAIEDPLSMLQQKFMSGYGIEGDACVLTKLESYERARVHRAAAQLGLVCISVDAPEGGRWMVLGKERDVVLKEIAHIHQAKLVAQEEMRAAKRQRMEEKHAQMEEKHAQLLSKSNGKMSIEGQWHIICNFIEEQWPMTDDLTLSILRTRKGKLEGKFDFGVIAGLLKFKREISKAALVSQGERFEFRWRGQEVDTGRIWYMDKEQRGWVSLRSDGHLEGQFKWQGRYKLSGFKASENPVEINETWDGYGVGICES